jgi:hypothetical protein
MSHVETNRKAPLFSSQEIVIATRSGGHVGPEACRPFVTLVAAIERRIHGRGSATSFPRWGAAGSGSVTSPLRGGSTPSR